MNDHFAIFASLRNEVGSLTWREFTLLMAIARQARNGGELLTTTQAARTAQIPKPAVTRATDKLEALGLVRRVQKDDHVRVYLELTEKGRAVDQRLAALVR